MSRNDAYPTCAERLEEHYRSRMADLCRLWRNECDGMEDDEETLADYGLCFDYVAPNTFEDQPEGYFRYQLSWGGPSDEFRFYVNPDFTVHRIEYWFLDWFDGTSRHPDPEDGRLLTDLWEWFRECGAVEAAFRERS
ncbi:hypothetical protein [Rhodobium gokarnense]|uniref:Uncharacterized protein n=1 Tax=Rhodobium gokarnense TaxID=364296 RepID=A0ABT3HEY4_9HYPH|nr:hypothetical protein [Rhodobium gokarnense]MCW2308948.1 hypothetical protein [Rhodobium gokarnense]